MFKRALAISMAFVGVVVGAGFASGQEALVYFVAFGSTGIWAMVLSAVLMLITGIAILQLGSYFRATDHNAVYSEIAGPVSYRILDWGTITTLFCIGFIMFAGGGANINQQFPSIPTWVGGLVLLILVLIVGRLDVDKVTNVIGAITPFIIIFIVGVAIYTMLTSDIDYNALDTFARGHVDPAVPNPWLGAANYTGMNVMCAVSMGIVIGGNFLDNKTVGLGGIIGGIIFILLMALLVGALFINIETVYDADIPVLALVNSINPLFGYAMTFIIYGMIFNTAVGQLYALAKRITRKKPENFYKTYVVACLVGFVLSFAGFKQLVSFVFPILGYIGLFMIAVVVFNWARNRKRLSEEQTVRDRARTLVQRKLDPRERFTKKNELELAKLAAASNMETEEFEEVVSEEIHEDLESDDDIEYDREDPSPSVTYVVHTKPVAQEGVADTDVDFGAKA
ncbi:membrane protein [Corynebacterium phocae]|uniref:Membrane protein n=1 Tax=Corynebacterium phocae TaxID=161895 RepID=A0A1L7D0X7_9CORY|nr:hypothetical protein [Corynebacterium phocae]APT91740.1 membrane protein [Corynebacterium phocae]KAA8728504.1 hypothetical protein F4V58_00580 [Corynebacterium phocae]